MKLLISSSSLGMAAHWQNVLSAAGIRTELRNIYLSSVAGDVPPQDCAAQVWLVNPAQEAQARALLDQAQHPPTCLLYTSPSPRDRQKSRMPSSA